MQVGGLLKTCRGLISNSDGDLTFLGTVMASLPVDVHLSKMIVLGQLFSCLQETVIIGEYLVQSFKIAYSLLWF